MPSGTLGVPLPSEGGKRWFRVIYPKLSEVVRATFLADTFFGQYLHFEGRSMGCAGSGKCAHCKAGLPFKWGGFIAIFDHGRKERAILSLTTASAQDCLLLLAQHQSLRGLTVEARRVNPRNGRSRVGIRLISQQRPSEVMPEHPIIESLNRLWSMNEQWVRDQDPTTLEPVKGAVNVGAPIPAVPMGEDYDRPTPDQRKRLKEVLGGMFGMPE